MATKNGEPGWTLPPCGHLECADRLHVGCAGELEDVEDAEQLVEYLEDGER